MKAEASMPTKIVEAEASIPKKNRRKMTAIVKKQLAAAPTTAIAKASSAGPPTDEGCFVKGTIMQLKEEGRCSKCGYMVERSKAKISGKGKSYWVCKVCHTRCT